MEFLSNLNEIINNFLANAGMWEPLLSSVLIVLEGILAFLPLFVFVTVNLLTMGNFVGSIVSWICTILGSFIAFSLFRHGLSPLLKKFVKNPKKLNKLKKMITNMPFSRLVLIISIPATPSFFVNLAAGLSDIPKKKYLYALLLGKLCIIIFWGALGTSLVECLNNPIVLLKVVIMLVVCNLFSKLINKCFKLDDVFEENKERGKNESNDV